LPKEKADYIKNNNLQNYHTALLLSSCGLNLLCTSLWQLMGRGKLIADDGVTVLEAKTLAGKPTTSVCCHLIRVSSAPSTCLSLIAGGLSQCAYLTWKRALPGVGGSSRGILMSDKPITKATVRRSQERY
jgi:hypothetical protein